MSVELFADPTHKAVVFQYSTQNVFGETITVRAENVDTGDVGERKAFNTGTFTLFYPFDFHGTDHITVTGGRGGKHTGTVDIT